jgi:tRNA threonylcarbamoyladenosine biosynthesis protein TsaB
LILFSSPLELEIKKIKIMNNLVIDAISEKIFLTLISDKNVYTCCHENSKNNFEKLIILISNFLDKNKSSFDIINNIYVNRGPGSFAGIRNSLSTVKGLFLTKKIDYYCFSYEDFNKLDNIKYEDIPSLCNKFKIKKNLIKPIYLS